MTRDVQQLRDSDARATGAADIDVDAEHNPEVSRRTSNAGLRREVQRKATATADEQQVHAAAAQGIAGPSQALPFRDRIQAAFGDHDVSRIQAHVAPGAAAAMGAEAYATGDHVVFGAQPDLHTAAHEAAHVVQQQKGVQLKGGVGAEGDSYERAADEVADHVVAGKSAAHLLGAATDGGASSQAVQKKPAAKTEDPKAAHDKSDSASYGSVQSALMYFAKQLHAWGPQLDAATNATTKTEAGEGPTVNAITAIYEQAKHDANMISRLILTADKSVRTTLSPEVRKVQGAYTRFWGHANAASGWMYNHKYGSLDLMAIQTPIDGYTSLIGYDGQKLDPDQTAPTGDEKAMSKEMIEDQFQGLEAALASVKAGNDGETKRVNLHLEYLANIAKEHPSELKSHKAELKKISKQLDEISKENPTLGQKLVDAHIHISNLLK